MYAFVPSLLADEAVAQRVSELGYLVFGVLLFTYSLSEAAVLLRLSLWLTSSERSRRDATLRAIRNRSWFDFFRIF